VAPPKLNSQQQDDEHKKFKNIANNPDLVSQNMTDSIKDIQGPAPNISQHLQVLGGHATSFLASKAPQSDDHLNPFSEGFKPSKQELTKFNNFKKIVEDPLHALEQVKDRTIDQDTIETLNTVYPKLYEELKQKVLERAFEHKEKGKTIPFQTRQAISTFIGQPLEQALDPQAILANQLALAQGRAAQGGQNPQKPRAKGLDNMEKSDRLTNRYSSVEA
jgi:hypothetical protein